MYIAPISYWKPPTRLAEAPNSKYSLSPRCQDEAISSLLYDKFKAKLEGKLTENMTENKSNMSNKSNVVLPIFHAKDDILRHIEENQTVLISGMYHVYIYVYKVLLLLYVFYVYCVYLIYMLTLILCTYTSYITPFTIFSTVY